MYAVPNNCWRCVHRASRIDMIQNGTSATVYYCRHDGQLCYQRCSRYQNLWQWLWSVYFRK